MDRSTKGHVQFNKTPSEIIQERSKQLTPEQEAYQQHMADIKSRGKGLPGPIKVPPLGAMPLERGGTMSEQADILRDATSPLSPAYNPNLAMMMDQQKQAGPFPTVPPEAAKDPRFRHGVGSMTAANQPDLNGPYKPVLSPETVEAIKDFSDVAEKLQQTESTKKPDIPAEIDKKIEEDSNKQLDDLRSFIGNDDTWNLLNNPIRRKEIEGRLTPLNIEDLILYGEVRQDVTIRPKSLVVSYRSTTGEEDLAVKRLMYNEQGGDRFMLDKFALMNLTLAVTAINGKELPPHQNERKKFDEVLFLKKFDTLMRFPVQFLADLAVQGLWFDERVRRLFLTSAEELKNS